MALNLYRRHGSNCPGGRALHEMSYETDELQTHLEKMFLPHLCVRHFEPPVQAKNTEKTSWLEAKGMANQWEAAGKWDENTQPALPPSAPSPLIPSAPSKPSDVTIERATAAFLAEHGESSSPNTHKKYSIIINKREHGIAEDPAGVQLLPSPSIHFTTGR